MVGTDKEINTGKEIKKIPYGISDYELIRMENYYYVDKTRYLATIEEAGRYLFFIRPGRFGKSLFLSLLESYYDVHYKDRFEEFFKNTRIYNHPTEERGNYLILSLNFSAVSPEPDKVETSFLNHVQNSAVYFIEKYDSYLSGYRKTAYFSEKIEGSRSAVNILSTLFQLCKGAGQKLYVIVDEYDNFANTILTTVGEKAYEDLTHGPGFFRSFFNVLKRGTSGTGAPVTRSFITGVLPVTIDDVTSGYNIGRNVSIDPMFDRMLGFTHAETLEMVTYYRQNGRIKHDTEYLMDIMTQWYGNYRFSVHQNEENVELLYNSDMVLYFLGEYFIPQRVPGPEQPVHHPR